jgi:uncharacterized protein YceK
VITSGCATAFVRSESTVDPQHVYPATAFDGEFFWKAGVKGEPLFATVDPKDRNGPVTRIAYGVGAIIDLPFSIVFDTVLLPLDLTRSKAPARDRGTEGEPDGPANGSQPIRSETNRTSSAAGSRR